MSDVTLVLDAINRGERQAAERLLPLVYDELRNLAFVGGRTVGGATGDEPVFQVFPEQHYGAVAVEQTR